MIMKELAKIGLDVAGIKNNEVLASRDQKEYKIEYEVIGGKLFEYTTPRKDAKPYTYFVCPAIDKVAFPWECELYKIMKETKIKKVIITKK